ncbi:hypothetical protein SAMN02910358_00304 [Lachnospiraceae bacterium XBB1006]|nr:hypothetical protein SAMN02910358_00304 [Lachnospiraceae bacterium XBB1006]
MYLQSEQNEVLDERAVLLTITRMSVDEMKDLEKVIEDSCGTHAESYEARNRFSY